MSVTADVMEVDGERLWIVTDGHAEDAERVVRVVLMRERGFSLRAIGRAVGRSHEWVRQQVKQVNGRGIGAGRVARADEEENNPCR